MKKLVVLLFLLVSGYAIACEKYVIGFKGINDIFDSRAFADYSSKQKSCYKLFSHNQDRQSLKFISSLTVPYQLYGYSAGAATISRLLLSLKKQALSMPEYIITIGAYKTTDVNFDSYNIKYNNYFDESGQGQKSPGVLIRGVSHSMIQNHVNNFILPM